MMSNCLVHAKVVYWRRLIAWWRAGRPAGREVYALTRVSRALPVFDHRLVGRWRDCPYCGGGVAVESFKPLDDRPLRWREVLKMFLFRGRWVAGDRPTFK